MTKLCWYDVIVNFFDIVIFLLSYFVNDLPLMSIKILVVELWQFLFIRDLTRIPEIENTPAWIFSNIWKLKQVWDTKFRLNVSNEKLVSAVKCQAYSFCNFRIISSSPTPRLGSISLIVVTIASYYKGSINTN